MHAAILGIHNILRWVVIVLLVAALYRAYRGLRGKSAWTPADSKAGLFLTISLDIQFLLGLLLYFVYNESTKAALRDFGAMMRSTDGRFFSLEHPFYMLVVVTLAHIGSAAGKKDIEDEKKFKRAVLFYTLTALALILGMPWMRPLLPGLG
ncbi:MAG: hypothetical protein OEZ02_04035 [Anaerolineae bacterium]|nr:hypothetical protein [Anaerolineae bacterium]